MKIIGLTGSIATGKSFVADIFRQKNIIVFDSDLEVAKLLDTSEIIDLIKNNPQLKEGALDKRILSKIVFHDKTALKALEDILHPLIEIKVKHFIQENKSEKIIVLEIPLLFEKNYQTYCDKVITTYCSKKLQLDRALTRKNIDEDRFNFIIKQQMPINLKALLTDYIVYTEISDDYTKKQIDEIFNEKRNNS